MEKEKLIMSYDREADVVYIRFGEPRKAVAEEIDPYVIVRRDPDSKEIVGITITDFSTYFEKRKDMRIEIPART